MKIQPIIVVLLLLCLGLPARAQTPSDAIMMPKGELCLAAVYEHSTFDEYWEGTLLRTNATIATVNRNAIMPMFAFGIFDRLNLLAGLPYVETFSTVPNGGKFAGAKGWQDVSLNLKAEVIRQEKEKATLSVLAVAGFSTPVSNYLSDYRPYSIGSGTNQLSLRGILQYEFRSGLYGRVSGAYLWRGQTEAERDYYYNNGSYYTAWMDVPSAWNVDLVAGAWLFDYALRLEAVYTGLRSTTGDDIRAYNAPQPTNKVNFDQLSLTGQYYFKNGLKGLGLLASFSHTLNGRNVGKATGFGAGLTYQFKL
jgi:hypothetical protein